MSGICAVWRKENPGRTALALGSMATALAISQREQVRTEVDRPVGLAVSACFAGQQIYRNGQVAVACDADLCQEDDLWSYCGGRQQDIPAGLRTAALMAGLYERFGGDFPDKLRGAFSIILWDIRRRTLLAAIDGFAIKRLVYYEDAQALLIASRIDALRKGGDLDGAVNPHAIVNVLNFTTSLAPETAFRNVFRLLPGRLCWPRMGRRGFSPIGTCATGWPPGRARNASPGNSNRWWRNRLPIIAKAIPPPNSARF